MCTNTIITLIGFKAKVNIRIDRIVSVFLQFVGPDLVHQSNAASLLVHIQNNPLTFFLDLLHSHVELFAAVATVRAENIASRTRRMNTDQDRLTLFPFTLNQRHMLQTIVDLSERDKAEIAIFSRHLHLFATFNSTFATQAVGNKVAYGDNLDTELFSHLQQVRHTRHSTVLIHNFNEAGRRVQSSKAGQINSSLSMSGTGQDTLVLRIERMDVSGTAKSGRCRSRIGQSLYSSGTVVRRNTGRTAFQFIDSNSKWSTQNRSVIFHLPRYIQFLTTLNSNRGTEDTTSELKHEVNLLFVDGFGSGNEVTLILTVLIINNN